MVVLTENFFHQCYKERTLNQTTLFEDLLYREFLADQVLSKAKSSVAILKINALNSNSLVGAHIETHSTKNVIH